MASHSVLDIAAFRVAFPAFANPLLFSDAILNTYYKNAGTFIDQNDNYCGGLSGDTLDFCLQLMLAHLLFSFDLIRNGKTNVIVTSSTVADVAVSLEPPPAKDGWEWWLATSPYGIQLLSLLTAQSVGGWSVGGSPETSAFRKAGGWF